MTPSRFSPVVLVAVISGFLGPRFTSPQDRAAGAPFDYAPPEGFLPVAASNPADKDGRAWAFSDPGARTTATINVTHTKQRGPIEDADLAALAKGMPAVFKETGVDWTEVRHEARVRSDGAHVGLIEGACERGALKYRVVQLVFPDDAGTSIVTASFSSEDAARWEPQIEATIASTTGVAFRFPPPPGWMFAAWAAVGAFAVAIATALSRRAKTAARAPSAPPASSEEHRDAPP
jgi:hypothetical protein